MVLSIFSGFPGFSGLWAPKSHVWIGLVSAGKHWELLGGCWAALAGKLLELLGGPWRFWFVACFVLFLVFLFGDPESDVLGCALTTLIIYFVSLGLQGGGGVPWVTFGNVGRFFFELECFFHGFFKFGFGRVFSRTCSVSGRLWESYWGYFLLVFVPFS